MSTPRERAEQLFSRSDRQTALHDRRDSEIFALRRARDEENHAKTERLKALRLAHEASQPKPAPKAAKTRRGKTDPA